VPAPELAICGWTPTVPGQQVWSDVQHTVPQGFAHTLPLLLPPLSTPTPLDELLVMPEEEPPLLDVEPPLLLVLEPPPLLLPPEDALLPLLDAPLDPLEVLLPPPLVLDDTPELVPPASLPPPLLVLELGPELAPLLEATPEELLVPLLDDPAPELDPVPELEPAGPSSPELDAAPELPLEVPLLPALLEPLPPDVPVVTSAAPPASPGSSPSTNVEPPHCTALTAKAATPNAKPRVEFKRCPPTLTALSARQPLSSRNRRQTRRHDVGKARVGRCCTATLTLASRVRDSQPNPGARQTTRHGSGGFGGS
jgi:hypothetical protein